MRLKSRGNSSHGVFSETSEIARGPLIWTGGWNVESI